MVKEIKSKEPMHFRIQDYDKENFEESHLLRADMVELINNHLMFYLKKVLIFKVWLKEKKWKKYKSLKEAMGDVGIKLYKSQ